MAAEHNSVENEEGAPLATLPRQVEQAHSGLLDELETLRQEMGWPPYTREAAEEWAYTRNRPVELVEALEKTLRERQEQRRRGAPPSRHTPDLEGDDAPSFLTLFRAREIFLAADLTKQGKWAEKRLRPVDGTYITRQIERSVKRLETGSADSRAYDMALTLFLDFLDRLPEFTASEQGASLRAFLEAAQRHINTPATADPSLAIARALYAEAETATANALEGVYARHYERLVRSYTEYARAHDQDPRIPSVKQMIEEDAADMALDITGKALDYIIETAYRAALRGTPERGWLERLLQPASETERKAGEIYKAIYKAARDRECTASEAKDLAAAIRDTYTELADAHFPAAGAQKYGSAVFR